MPSWSRRMPTGTRCSHASQSGRICSSYLAPLTTAYQRGTHVAPSDTPTPAVAAAPETSPHPVLRIGTSWMYNVEHHNPRSIGDWKGTAV
jgi:hypothetical protein